MLLGTLGASLLGNLLADKGEQQRAKGLKANIPVRGTIRVGEGTVRAGQDLTNF